MYYKKILATLIVFALFFSTNFRWSQAALAWIASSENCSVQLIRAATMRIEERMGRIDTNPVILCNPKTDFGMGVKYGSTRFAPLLPTIVILGPNGLNLDVAAHELAHAHIAARTSALLRTYRIPVWFDEGLAMQFDHRQNYSTDALRIYLQQSRDRAVKQQIGIMPDDKLSLDKLRNISGFFVEGSQARLHYAFARCVVGSWLDGNNASQPMLLLDETSWGRSFPSRQFETHEKACLEL